ncbi:hypothetical protein C8Q77DRAFT_1164437 [Trametes polyzona]|nr:hypothetical protein C8Q77DRAFT_1164437 [Trametes polyzona]
MADAGLTAATLLAQIRSESLQSLLAAVKTESSPPGLSHIPALDAHLAAVNARRTFRNWPLNHGDVVEIQGPAASGKTHFVYHLLITCLLPESRLDVELGGWGKSAVIIDTDGTFSIRRLHALFVFRLRRFLGDDDPTDVTAPSAEDLATQYLQDLHVFRPTSSAQLAITLLHLPDYHASNPRLQDKAIGLLAVDSMSAFYWRDRYTLEQLRDAADSSSRTPLPPNPLLHVLKSLAKFRASHRPVILMTNWGLNPLSKLSATGEPASPYYRQHLHPFPAPFEPHGAADALSSITASQPRDGDTAQLNDAGNSRPSSARSQAVTLPLHYHITLHPSPIDPFPSTFTLRDAIRHEDMRAVLVKRGEVKGLVRTPGEDIVGEFTFRIGEQEVLVDPDEVP